MTRLAPITGLFLLLSAAPVPAGLLVYEGFDPSDAGLSLSSGALAGATSVGFASGSTWQVTGTDDYSADYSGDGLTMPGLATVGGSVRLGFGGSQRGSSLEAVRACGAEAPAGSTLYGTFLFRNSMAESRFVSSFEIRPGAREAADVIVSPDSFARDEEGQPGRPTQEIKVRRHGIDQMVWARSENELPNGETFLVVWRLTNTAAAGQPSSGVQELVAWILSADNLRAVREGGDLTDSLLDSNNIATMAADRSDLTGGLATSDYLALSAAMGGGKRANASEFDELRIGTDLASVLPAE